MNNAQLSIGSSLPSMLATSLSVSILSYQNHREKVLGAEKYQAVRNCDGPLVQAVIENYQVWIKNATWAQGLDPATESSILFDTVAVYLAFSEDLLVMEKLGVWVTDQGYTIVDDRANTINCAVDWRDLSAFEDFLIHRLAGK